MTAKRETSITRFVLSQRIEHLLLLVSFTMLCLTGLPQLFTGSGWAQAIISALGGIHSVRVIHHLFAVILGFELLYHAIVVIYELLFKRPRSWAMVPGPKDVREAIQSVAYVSGLKAEKPKADRYDFKQKIEYWAMIWGMLVMGITGLILLFPITVTNYLPGVLVPAAKIIHGYEAVLAFLAIITWHFYNAHFSESAFPVDTSIFTGKISLHTLQEEHPLEYERLMAAKTTEAAPETSTAES